ncbi:MAG: hypothetical protein U1F20_03185 [Lysobacterales bacterium]
MRRGNGLRAARDPIRRSSNAARVLVPWIAAARVHRQLEQVAGISSERSARCGFWQSGPPSPSGEKWFIAINARRPAVKPIATCMPADRMVTVASYRIYLYIEPKPGCRAPPVKPHRG